jgi:hypothetical protein
MDKATPSRPQKQKTKPVEPPLSVEDKELFDESGNKYAPRTKIGKPSIGVPNRVERVGLGNLKVITTNGYTDVRSD